MFKNHAKAHMVAGLTGHFSILILFLVVSKMQNWYDNTWYGAAAPSWPPNPGGRHFEPTAFLSPLRFYSLIRALM